MGITKISGPNARVDVPLNGIDHATTQTPLVAICIATYQRPNYLSDLLKSLQGLEVRGFQAHLIVVDNDPSEGARPIVNALMDTLAFPATYQVEHRRGIASARNRLVDEAMNISADWVAFIDDDELISPMWLHEMLTCAIEMDADAVAGPYLPQYEADVPEWYIRSGINLRPRRLPSGTVIQYASTANALFRTEALRQIPGPFDVRMNLSGGSDVFLFRMLKAAGFKTVWCDNGYLYEQVPASRSVPSYILKRCFRDGIVMAKTTVWVSPTPKSIAIRVAKALGLMGLNLALIPVSFPYGKAQLLPRLAEISRGTGTLYGLFGRVDKYEMYREIQGT